MANEWPKTPEFVFYNGRCELAKLIYGMTDRQQRKFREKFPMGFGDSVVGHAIEYARKISGSSMTLQEIADKVMQQGPNRVIVDREGYAVPPWRALRDYGYTPDVVFIRADGWTLGAPQRYEKTAEALWADEWIGVMRPSNTIAEEYKRT
jgi:hypothetical protein